MDGSHLVVALVSLWVGMLIGGRLSEWRRGRLEAAEAWERRVRGRGYPLFGRPRKR